MAHGVKGKAVECIRGGNVKRGGEPLEIVYMDGMSSDFFMLCTELDDFMLNFSDVDKAAYTPYGRHEDIHDAFVAYEAGTPLGCASFRKQADGIAELKRMYVRERYQGRGISKILLIAVEDKAREAGFHTITLGTLLTLRPAVNLYHSFGYKDISKDGLYVRMAKQI